MVPLNSSSNFLRTFEMSLISCEINLILTWSIKWIISFNSTSNEATNFKIIVTNPYAPVAILSTPDNTKLIHQLKSGFKRITSWKKYQSKTNQTSAGLKAILKSLIWSKVSRTKEISCAIVWKWHILGKS